MTRDDALDEVIRCARLVADTGGADSYFIRELQMALEELDRANRRERGDET